MPHRVSFAYGIATPFAADGRQILGLIRKRAPEAEIQPIIEAIHDQAAAQGSMDPLVQSTDAYVTAVCFIGSKSLSHVLSCIERCKERLLGIGRESEAARRQIVGSVVAYWQDLPGVAVNIVDKLLNYTIVTPEAVIRWCLGEGAATAAAAEGAAAAPPPGAGLADSWRYELVAATMGKVTNRVRQIVAARLQAVTVPGMALPPEQLAALDGTLAAERDGMRELFALVDQLLLGQRPAAPPEDEQRRLAAMWAERWARTFRRMGRREECVVGEDAVRAAAAVGGREAERKAARDEVREARREEERVRLAEEERVRAELEEQRRVEREERWKVEQEEKTRLEAEEGARAAKEEEQAVAAAREAENGVDLDEADVM
jgi:nuclear cap-binding protein subunit 1